jgi:MSHA type pilus biogenesis protein MshL
MVINRRAAILWLCLGLTACEDLQRIEEHDPELKYTKKEYEQMLSGQGDYARAAEIPPPYYPPKLAEKIPQEMQTLVSLSVTDKLSLNDVFMELARQAKINISLSPKVQGGVFFQAHKQPAIDVIEEICHMGSLRYSVQNKTVRIEPDEPYMKTYNLQFLSLTREKKNRISMTTDVFTAIEGSVRDFDNGSSTLLTGDSKINFWDELGENLGHILNPHDDEDGGSYTVHQQAGIVTITGKQSQHKQVQQYIKDLLYSSQLQVVIEAKIVEVNLNDEFKSGINWQSLKGDFVVQAALGEIAPVGRLDKAGALVKQAGAAAFDKAARPLRDVFTIGGRGETLTALASVLSKFGTVRTLSSPRVTVLNNQTSVLKVATNRVFFKLNYYRDIPTDDHPASERASSQIQTVPIGLVMVVQPCIDVETGRITMTLRPTISRIIGEKEDPAVAILSNNAQKSTVPEVQVRELDSVLQINTGDTIVMGGLMEDRSDDEHSGVPGLKDLPLMGQLFGGRGQSRQVSELVIFLRATVQQIPQIDQADQRVYEKFTRDPRPLAF